MRLSPVHMIGLGGLVAVSAMTGPNVPEFEEPVTPAGQAFQEVQEAHFTEFENGKARCGGEALGEKKECFTDTEGAVFRFGCIPGDERIFTDSCGVGGGCSEEDCDSRWMWGGEQQDTCYDDGSVLYHFSGCGMGRTVEPVVETPKSDLSSCAVLGWPLQPGDLDVCGYSKVAANGDCASADWAGAAETCAAVGARLCTASELANDETKNTGCKGDCVSVWSSDECVTDDNELGHYSMSGASKCSKQFPEKCETGAAEKVVRCCSDVDPDSALKVAYPPGFHPAIARDYKLSDGACGVAPTIGQYSCWTSSEKISMRFACSDSDDFIYVQSCGSDSECHHSNCDGEFKKTPELMGQCMERESEGYMYQYFCPGK